MSPVAVGLMVIGAWGAWKGYPAAWWMLYGFAYAVHVAATLAKGPPHGS